MPPLAPDHLPSILFSQEGGLEEAPAPPIKRRSFQESLSLPVAMHCPGNGQKEETQEAAEYAGSRSELSSTPSLLGEGLHPRASSESSPSLSLLQDAASPRAKKGKDTKGTASVHMMSAFQAMLPLRAVCHFPAQAIAAHLHSEHGAVIR